MREPYHNSPNISFHFLNWHVVIMKKRRNRVLSFIVFCVFVLFSFMTNNVRACRLLEPPAETVDVLWVHLEGFCFSGDQRELSVKGEAILEALENGKSLDLQGALVVGDVMLDQLPLQPLEEIPGIPQDIRNGLKERSLEQVRVISGSISIRDSQFENVLATNLVNDVLVILGEVDLSGTTFLQSVDFSKIIFNKPSVFSKVSVGYEAFFIGAQFEETTDFSHANFGTHSRFHKAVFLAPVSFAEVEFKGVAEFLEVQFSELVNFSNAKFLSGTGFSGSVFYGPAKFSGIQTHRETYFRFSEFRDGVSFRHAKFQNVIDFSNSQFDGAFDFSDAEFAVKPEFTESNISIEVPIAGQKINQLAQWLLFASLILLAGIYLWITKKNARNSSL